MNKVIIKGRLTRDPEIRQTNSGEMVARYTVAVDRYNSDADFIPCAAFRKSAEFARNYLHKGKEILVEGSIKTGSYEKDGHTIYTTDVIVDRQEFCGSRDSTENTQPAAASAPSSDMNDFQEVVSTGKLPF